MTRVLTRLLLGIIKGLVIGGLVGYGVAAAGLGWAWLAYVAAAVTGILVALLAGKPIWAKDARIEVGMKAVAGAILAPLLLWAVRSFLTMGLPIDPASLPGLESLASEGLTLGTFSVSALAIVAAVLAGFYDADNSPQPEAEKKAAKKKAVGPKRIEAAAPDGALEAAELEAAEAEAVEKKRRS